MGRRLLDLGWAAGRARASAPRTDLLDGLAVLNGQCNCLRCGRAFSIYQDAIALLE